jgi:hypothetical protein
MAQDFAPITDQQRAANKAFRLACAADPLDGLTVRIRTRFTNQSFSTSFASHGTSPGSTVILSRGSALQAIADGHAELAE